MDLLLLPRGTVLLHSRACFATVSRVCYRDGDGTRPGIATGINKVSLIEIPNVKFDLAEVIDKFYSHVCVCKAFVLKIPRGYVGVIWLLDPDAIKLGILRGSWSTTETG